MMQAHISFDTLEYMDELKRGGLNQPEAEAITKATSKAFTQMMLTKELCTKKDLTDLRTDLQGFIVKAITSTIFILGSIQTFLHYMR
jgi:hypothetical protein